MASLPPTPATPATPKKPGAADSRALLFGAIGIIIGVLATLAVMQGMTYYRAQAASGAAFLAKNKSGDKTIVETASGLQYKILSAGTGTAKPTDADIALVNYEGKLTDGTGFDKSQQPTPMAVAGVVPGFAEALKLMPKGAKYRVWIKPSLGYGDKATGPIPANSVLVFDLELLDFLPESVVRQMQMQQQMMQQGGAPGAPGAAPPPPGARPKQ